MKYRTFGRTGIKVSEIGFGCWGIGGQWGSKDDDESVQVLQKAFELGVTFYDTAMAYGNGHSESLIQKALGNKRDQIVIATKIPPKTWRWPARPSDPIDTVFPASWVIECTEKSLKALGTDCIDIQQLHTWIDPYTEDSELFAAADTLKTQGKIRAFGVSANDWDPYGATGLVKSGKTDSVQVIYNIFEQRPEEKLFPAAIDQNVGIIVRVPFEEGLLAGAIPNNMKWPKGDWRKEWLPPARLKEANARVDRLRPFLDQETPTLAELALKFTLAHPAVSTVIPGMRRISRIEPNCRASSSKPLSKEVVQELHKHAFVHGWQYPWIESSGK